MALFSLNKEPSNFPCLVGVEGEFQGRSIEISDSFTIGRRKNNTLVLADNSVSGFHVKIEKVDGIYEIEDLGSKNRTRLNGRKIFKRLELVHEDTIKIGISSFRFECPNSLPIPSKLHPYEIDVPRTSKTDIDEPTIKIHPSWPHSEVTQPIPRNVYTGLNPNEDGMTQIIHRDPKYTKNSDIEDSADENKIFTGKKIARIAIIAILVVIIVIVIWPNGGTPTPVNDPKLPPNEITRQERLRAIWDNRIVDLKSPNLARAHDVLDDAQHDFSETVFDPSFKPEELWKSYLRCLEAEAYLGDAPEFESIKIQIRMLKKSIQSEIEFHENQRYNSYWINKNQNNWARALEEIERIEILLDLNDFNSESSLSQYYRIVRIEAEKQRDRR